ncbi:uncharacterized protein PHACADRAFT_186064 [Phanerochaete carnosa HHB-10118-sp]|uniref:Transmembrane protein n=1 Tax=Phanerochaete carnosa (strain HHB-10118-sp) TaxID=650164 RepID=K5W2P8_PHACS|nr:uncharacterized protein PHACADRAFT_186064 [Phanerochaete carnosa HHB-10118-sp]EKM53385.1 hypothetical protein PHACADRAFT_186064 [Phanerochaete carnosa HHB-10118-sp]
MTSLRSIIPGRTRRRGDSMVTNGPPSPSPIQWTDFARRGLFVETPGALSRMTTNENGALHSAVPLSALSGLQDTSLANTPRKWTQEDQNKKDEDARLKALKELVISWTERLQLISVITTFFAAIESQLLGIVTPGDNDSISGARSASAATLSSALVVHSFAAGSNTDRGSLTAILSFVAAFFLVRFRVHEANQQEIKVEQKLENGSAPGPENHKLEPGQTIPPLSGVPVWSANPTLEQVGPLRRGKPPTHLLENCHTLCMILSVVGFVLAMVGIMSYVWAMLPWSSRVLSTVTIGLSVVSSVVAVLLPQNVSILSPSHVVDS